ncbi:MAG: hypothetical protein RDV48_00690 [Candidatus Eremiobacteraeota bacterium]|nr:hypothetical protein [Candidatus Eremiobacteraeota bacterium]
MKHPLLFVAVVLLLSTGPSRAAELGIDFTWPSYPGDFYASGTVSFPPGAVKTPRNITVFGSGGSGEQPVKVSGEETWPDGSLLSCEVTFAANSGRKESYVLRFGPEVRGTRVLTETAVLPTISFFTGGAPRTSENVNMDVGQLNVMVDRSPAVFYYWHVIPIMLLTVIVVIRGRRAGRPR